SMISEFLRCLRGNESGRAQDLGDERIVKLPQMSQSQRCDYGAAVVEYRYSEAPRFQFIFSVVKGIASLSTSLDIIRQLGGANLRKACVRYKSTCYYFREFIFALIREQNLA